MRLLIMNWLNYFEFYVILTYSLSAAIYDSDESALFSHYCVPEIRSRFESFLRSKLLPDKACGISSARRSVGGKDAKLGAYPWMARLVYINPDNSTSKEKCGGSLINTRFVLTAAHCLIDLPFEMALVAVRLGEHDIRYNPDCEGQICADPPQDFKPLSVIPHRDYDLPIHRNDIGLIRLDREAMITRWVSPICLPYKDMGTDYTGFDVTAAGWGNINQEKMSSPVLQEVTLKVVDISNCTKIYSTRYSINIGSSQFCTKGQNNKDTCYGDSGGPLMRQRIRKDYVLRYFLLGFVITGPGLCGFPTDVPAIATKVVEYLDWILYTIDDDCKK